MQLPADTMLTALRAVGEETRLRIVSLLQHGELTVSDLTDILGQSQPRISRHLKLLAEAGVVDKHREGTWAFFELATHGAIGELIGDVLAHTDDHDPVLAADLDRLAVARQRRASQAQEYFTAVAERWDEVRSLHAADETVEAAMDEMLGGTDYRTVLDLGTGTGRMLQLFGDDPAVTRAVGLDSSHSMLAVARANLERSEVRRVDLRQGDVYSPPFEPESFDLVVIHQVLHFLDDPGRAVREAARLLSPNGKLLIVDFAPHALEFLRTDHAHRRLGFASEVVDAWLEQAGLEVTASRTIAPVNGDSPDATSGEWLTVSLWLASDRREADTDEAATETEVEASWN
ncbi:MAG: metalloregulator ArsR/SmtB family transcription factor [Ilumatobacter sp.]|uniref:ArsR/SmtB family transcription factor n=1 Tax=Ilumatobacter sp. TaxID=1967498 RepID=UPI002617BE76|nr:metalloregulator ArsR/SmtB family transcription factor [Ilumatobacter sp.]MDJ0767968.1 metalloregulator ArsR/SmtB family transcription factor [Ilumatobacter sp.]